MDPDRLSRRTLRFINVAHALDHFVLLIYPSRPRPGSATAS